MMDFEGVEKVRQRVRQNGTLARQLQLLQQRLLAGPVSGGAPGTLSGTLPVAAAARAMDLNL